MTGFTEDEKDSNSKSLALYHINHCWLKMVFAEKNHLLLNPRCVTSAQLLSVLLLSTSPETPASTHFFGVVTSIAFGQCLFSRVKLARFLLVSMQHCRIQSLKVWGFTKK